MGRFYALICALSSGLLPIFMKCISKNVNFFTIITIQNALGTFLCLAIARKTGETIYHPETTISNFLLLRGLFGGSLFLFFNYGMRHLPPQVMVVLNNTLLSWVVILSPFIIGQYPDTKIICFLVVSFLGVIVMAYPSLILPDSWVFPEGSTELPQNDYPW